MSDEKKNDDEPVEDAGDEADASLEAEPQEDAAAPADAAPDDAGESAAAEGPKKPKRRKDPAAKWTRRVLGFCVLFFIWYLVSDRWTPYTSQGRIRGFVVPIVPQVSGIVEKVDVDLNQVVSEGDLLVQIQKRDFEIARTKAEAALEQAGQDVGANTEAVSAATASLVEAQAQLDLDRTQLERIERAEKTAAVAKAEADEARSKVKLSEARVENAKADLEQAKQRMGQEGAENAAIQSAQAALEDAALDLSRTTILAPGEGGVTNVRLEVGQYATAGQPLMTFVSSRSVWVEAYMRENSLGRIKEGNEVDLVLDAVPGKIYKGTVRSIGYGVEWGDVDSASSLPKISAPRDWLRDSQRFPVVIDLTEETHEQTKGLRREGGQVDILIYNTDNPVLRGLGRFWIRIVSWLTYVS